MRRFLQKFCRAKDGATAVEFAMVSGIFFMFIGGIMECGLLLFYEYSLQNGLERSSRLIRTGQAQGKMNSSQFKTLVCEHARFIANCESSVYVYVDSALTFQKLKDKTDILDRMEEDPTKRKTVFNMGDKIQAVFVMASYDWTFKFPFMNILSNMGKGSNKRRLVALSIFQNEPFSK